MDRRCISHRTAHNSALILRRGKIIVRWNYERILMALDSANRFHGRSSLMQVRLMSLRAPESVGELRGPRIVSANGGGFERAWLGFSARLHKSAHAYCNESVAYGVWRKSINGCGTWKRKIHSFGEEKFEFMLPCGFHF
jgi:hypothetical protein